MYVNPIEILGISNISNASDINSEIIKKAKRKLFAEIDLSDDGFLDYHGLRITKSICECSISELDDDSKKEFYLYLANNNLLNNFLASGDEKFFENIKHDSIFVLHEFVFFISKYYAERFDKSVLNAVKSDNDLLLRKILSTSHLILADHLNNSFKSVSNYIDRKLKEVEILKNKISNKSVVYGEKEIESLLLQIKKDFPRKTINCLPSYFSSQILKIANAINYISIEIYGASKRPDLSLLFTEYLLGFNISGVDKKTFDENFVHLESESKKRIERIENSKIFERWELIVSEINLLTDNIIESKSNSKNLLDNVKKLFQIDDLNNLPKFANEIRENTAIALRLLSLAILKNTNDIRAAIELLSHAILISTNESIRSQLLKDKNDLIEIENQFRGVLNCYFCESNPPHEPAKLVKRIYKINERKHGKIYFSYLDVNISRCDKCRKIHNRIVLLYFAYLIGFPVLGGFIWSIFNEAFIFGSVIGLFLGYIIIRQKELKILKSNKTKEKSNLNLRLHPIILPKIQEGWTFDEPTQ